MEQKYIYFDLNRLHVDYIPYGLLENGCPTDRAGFDVPDCRYSPEDLERVLETIEDYDIVISQNFSAVLAEAAHIKQRIYISWIFDAPQQALYMQEALYDTNAVFVFDKAELKRLRNRGIRNIYYQPLAANISGLSGLEITDEDIAKYTTDALFIGRIYKDDTK